MSKQHIWPDWLKQVLPRTRTMQHQIQTRTDLRSTSARSITGPIVTSRPGDPAVRKVRKVCRSCNSGWMGHLETRARTFLIPLIKDMICVLQPSDQTIVSAWAAMTVTTAAFDNPRAAAVPFSDRQWLMYNGQPPIHWKIWLGKYRGGHGKNWFRHHGFRFSLPTDPSRSTVSPVIGNGDNICNAQVTTIITGALLLHAFSSTISSVRFDEVQYARNLGIRIIWPGTGKPIVWDDLSILRDTDAETIADALMESFS